MRVLSFTEYIFENDSQQNEIEKYLEDGYSIRTIKKPEANVPNKIIISEENPHSYCLFYCDKDGKEKNKIWIPRDSVEVDGDGNEMLITIHPDKIWINKKYNRIALEDFLEDYEQHKIENIDSEESLLSEISDDIVILFDTLGIPVEIEGVEKKGDDEFEIKLGHGSILDFKRGSDRNMFDSMEFYRDPVDFQPSLSVVRKKDSPEFSCHTPELGKRIFSCELDEVPKDPYYNFLVKKCLGKETHGDGEILLQHLLDKAAENDLGSKTENDTEREAKKFLNDLKSAVSTYVPEYKLRQLLPSGY